MGRFRVPADQNKVSRSQYREYIFDSEVTAYLKRLGVSEQLISHIIQNPLRTTKDEEGRVVASLENEEGETLFVHHAPVAEGEPTPGVARTLDTQIQLVRLEGAKRL